MLTVGTIVVVLVVGVAIFIAWQHMKWLAGCRAGAAKIYREVREMYGGDEHFYRVASEDEFPNLDLSGYRRIRDAMVAHGFRHLGAYENVTATRVHPDHRTFIDSYVGGAGIVGAATYRVVDRQPVDFGSVLEDGRFLVTTNADLDSLTSPPAVMKCTLPADTPIEALLARHLERLGALRAAEPAARFHASATLDDALAVSRRHSRLVSEYRRHVGFLTEQEMLSFATRSDQEATARQVWKEFRVLRDGAKDAARPAA